MSSETVSKMGKPILLPNCKVELIDVNSECKSAALWSSVLHVLYHAKVVGTSGSCE